MFCANCGNVLDIRNQTPDGMVRCPVCGMNQPVPGAVYEQPAQPARRYRQTTGSYTPPQETYAPPVDAYAPPAPQQSRQYAPPQPQAYVPPAPTYDTPRFSRSVTAPVPAPEKKGTGRRVIGVFSLILGLAALLLTVFSLVAILAGFGGVGYLTVSVILSIIAVVLSGIGKGGCHIAGMILSIISLVFSAILLFIFFALPAIARGYVNWGTLFNFSYYTVLW